MKKETKFLANNLDLAFKYKKSAKKIINNSDEDQKVKDVANFALDHEKFTKDVAKLVLEEGTNVSESINEYSNQEEKSTFKFMSDNKRPINKSLDVAYDNKETVKEIIDKVDVDKNLQKVANFSLEHENFTKDVVNLAMDDGEKVENSFKNFSKKEEKNVFDYVGLVADNKEPIRDSVNVALENKQSIRDIMEEYGNEDLKNIVDFALENESLTRGVVDFALGTAEFVDKEFSIF